MFRPTQFLSVPMRRLRMTTKRGPKKGYYKGTRTGNVGEHTKNGGFTVNWEKVRTYVVPSEALATTQLRPFVAKLIEVPKQEKRFQGMSDAEVYLKRWKEENGKT